MIVEPIAYNTKVGFKVSNGMKILFTEGRLNEESKKILRRRKEKISGVVSQNR
jgi:hypothetical protein